MIFVITFVLGVLTGIILKSVIGKSTQGELQCGRNSETGGTVYRIEFDIPLEEVPQHRKVSLKVVHTAENLGINQRLYDLESEGIHG